MRFILLLSITLFLTFPGFCQSPRLLITTDIGGLSAMASKFTDLPGEQILSYSHNGWLKIWADENAHDNKNASERYSNAFYKINQKQTGNGYNLFTLGGI